MRRKESAAHIGEFLDIPAPSMEVEHRPPAGFLGRENRLGGPVLRKSCLRPLFFRRWLARHFGSLRTALAQLCAAVKDFIGVHMPQEPSKEPAEKPGLWTGRLTPVFVGLVTVC